MYSIFWCEGLILWGRLFFDPTKNEFPRADFQNPTISKRCSCWLRWFHKCFTLLLVRLSLVKSVPWAAKRNDSTKSIWHLKVETYSKVFFKVNSRPWIHMATVFRETFGFWEWNLHIIKHIIPDRITEILQRLIICRIFNVFNFLPPTVTGL